MPERKRTKNASSSSAPASRASTSPIARVRASVSARALADGRQPSSRAAARMRARVSGETPGRSLTAYETAAADTPARRAPPAIAGRRRGQSPRSLAAATDVRGPGVGSRSGGGDGIALDSSCGYPRRPLGSTAKALQEDGGMTMRRALILAAAMAMLPASAAQAVPEASTTRSLEDRREVASATRAYSSGFEDGRFYANGWHITGEMGGIWAPPLKLADGVWFGVDDQWAGPATKFTSGRGYVRYALPAIDGLPMQRTDFAPDGARAVLYGFQVANPAAAARTITVKVDVHSELMGAYPWSSTTPAASGNLPDIATYENNGLTFIDRGTITGGQPHDYTALVASPRVPDAGEVGPEHRGPQPGAICKDGDKSAPSVCDDGPFGEGTGGQLRYKLTLGSRTAQTVWIAVAGSDRGVADAKKELAKALADPDAQLAAKTAERDELAARSKVGL